MNLKLSAALLAATCLFPAEAWAQGVPTSPPVSFANSTSVNPGAMINRVLDSYAGLLTGDPVALTRNYRTVVTLTQASATSARRAATGTP